MINTYQTKSEHFTEGTKAVETKGLRKSFGSVLAVAGVDLTVSAGSVYGFLGRNGAGKTTLIRILATLIRPDEGTARIFGHDVVREAGKVRELVSLTGQFASLDENLSGLENLVLLARLRGYSWAGAKERALDLFEYLDLTEAARRQIKTYSGGMRRRLDIAASLISIPRLLFLDEPTTGLDPHNRKQIWDVIHELAADGITIFLTTQYMDEADQLADRIAIIEQGKIIAEGTTGDLKSRFGTHSLHVRIDTAEKRSDAERLLSEKLGFPVILHPDPMELSVRVTSSETAVQALSTLAQAGIGVQRHSYGQHSLDEVFLTITGRAAEYIPEAD